MDSSKTPDPHQADWQRKIEALEEQGRRAFLAQDIDQLRVLWSEDLVVNSPLNRVLERNQVLDLLQRGVIRHASFDVHIEVIRRHGDLVTVMGHDVVTDAPGAPPVQRRFTNVWHALGESWQMVARHAHPIAKP